VVQKPEFTEQIREIGGSEQKEVITQPRSI
jgi:hypothetical protein